MRVTRFTLPGTLIVSWMLYLCVVSVGAAHANEHASTFRPKHIAQLKSVVDARLSPDGQSVAYGLAVQRQPADDDDGPAWVELHVVGRDGNSRPFVTGHVNVGGIDWTADGKFIAYTARRNDDKHSSLYLIPVDGGESRRALSHATSVGGVSFHPDGKQVAFLAREDVDQATKDRRRQGFNQEIYEEGQLPVRVWLGTLFSDDEPRMLEVPGSASYVAWHPNGRELVVVLAPTPSVDDSYMYKRVRVVNAETGRVVEEINNPGKLGSVRWSPDGKHLAMISGVDIHDPSEGRLMVVAIPGNGALRDLMPDYEAHVNSFAWVDASTLRWVADEGTHTSVGTVGLNTSSQQLITATGPIMSGLSMNSDGSQFAMLGHTPRHPPEVFVMPADDPAPVRLTTSNSWMEQLEFARQETITWTVRDGLELGGVLVWPLNYVEGRRYPMIMVVHGGPEAHVSDGWISSYSNPGQVGAARGFVVFYPNYRGSTGRGVAFSKMGQADAAGKEFDDLVDGIDHLVSEGLVAADKVGITGGSYGGYASAWGATFYSDRYAASVMFVGISDNVSKVGTTDIPDEMYLVHHLKRLWDDWDYFIQRSPIHYVERNQTPTLILHGKEDPRVHPSQSLELHRHLKTLGKAPVRLVLYEGEGHGNRKAAARFDYSLRLMRWMEHYLQGPGGDPPTIDLDYEAALK